MQVVSSQGKTNEGKLSKTFLSKAHALFWLYKMRSSVSHRLSDAQFFAYICALAGLTGGNSSGGFSSENDVLQIVFRSHTFRFARKLNFWKKKFRNPSIFHHLFCTLFVDK